MQLLGQNVFFHKVDVIRVNAPEHLLPGFFSALCAFSYENKTPGYEGGHGITYRVHTATLCF